jgi:hypothetical protein
VTDEKNRNSSESSGGSPQVPSGAVPVEVGGFFSGGGREKVVVSYQTVPGIVFAYRLHAICPKRSPTAEVFKSKRWQKLKLSDVVDVVADQALCLTTIRALQRREAANVKRLE